MADTSLTDAIAEAADQIQTELDESSTTTEEKPSSEETTSDETTEETTEEKAEEETEEQREEREAKILYNGLKDAKTRNAVIEELALRAGIIRPSSPAETVTEKKAEKKQTLELLKEALGPEYAFLADRLSKGVDAVLDQERQDQAELKNQIETDKVITETKAAEADLNRETKGDFKKYEARITELVDLYPPGPRIGVKEYLHGLYLMASAGSTKVATTTKLADKIRSNANDSAGRLRQTGGGSRSEPDKEFRGKGALNNAVQYAIDRIAKESK